MKKLLSKLFQAILPSLLEMLLPAVMELIEKQIGELLKRILNQMSEDNHKSIEKFKVSLKKEMQDELQKTK